MNSTEGFLGYNSPSDRRLIGDNNQFIPEFFQLDQCLGDPIQQFDLIGAADIAGILNQSVITV